MTIETKDERVYLTADEGSAIHRIGTPVPSHTVGTSFPVGKDNPDNWEDCELGEPTPAVPTRYSVRKIIGELKTAGKFADVRALLETQKATDGYDWLFVGSNYLASDDPDFADICDTIVVWGIMTRAELDEMLPKCLWEQTPMA